MKPKFINYIDSSVILSFIFKETEKDFANECLKNKNNFSSKISIAETFNNLNKLKGKIKTNEDENLVRKKIVELQEIIQTIHFREMDDSILEIVKYNAELSKLKTLDALHLATAIYFKTNTDYLVNIVSFDKQMNQIAQLIGFPTIVNKIDQF